MKNKIISLLALIAAPALATAQVQLVAGWDFGQFTFEGFTYTVVDNYDAQSTSLPANFSSVGAFNPVKSHNNDNTPVSAGTGSISWSLADADAGRIFAVASSNTQNRTMPDFTGTLMSNPFSDTYGLGLGFSSASGNSFMVTVNLTNFSDYDPADHDGIANLTFSAAAESAISISWFHGATLVATSNIAGDNAHASYAVDLPSSFYGLESTLTGVIGGNAGLMIDNLQIVGAVGAPIPEPSTYALLFGVVGLGWVAYRRCQTVRT